MNGWGVSAEVDVCMGVTALEGGETLLTGWPSLKAELRAKNPAGDLSRPDIRLVYPAGSAPDPAFEDFRQSLPADTARIVEPFESHQWLMLRLMAVRVEAQELAAHNPVLVWLLANNDQFRRVLNKPPEFLAEWRLDYTQQRLLGWLGFPATNAVARLLRKVDPRGLSIPRLRLLRNALVEDGALSKALSHLPRINRGVVDVAVVARLRAWASQKLLAQIANNGFAENDGLADWLMAILDGADARNITLRPRRIAAIREIVRLEEELAHAAQEQDARKETARLQQEARTIEGEARCARALNNRHLQQLFGSPLVVSDAPRAYTVAPPPPDAEGITRLQTIEDARNEGLQQGNCVAESALEIASGRMIVYRVTKPERATLELRAGPDGHWQLAQLLSANNRSVSRPTKAHVTKWLDHYRAEVDRDRALGKYSILPCAAGADPQDTPF